MIGIGVTANRFSRNSPKKIEPYFLLLWEKNDFFKDLPRRGAKHLLATMAWAAFCTGTVYAQEWIDVTDTYITNADFSTGTTDGWDAGTALPGVNATC